MISKYKYILIDILYIYYIEELNLEWHLIFFLDSG